MNGEWKQMREECGAAEIKSYENTAYEMNHLRPDMHYRIRVYAHNRMGQSTAGEMYIKTARGESLDSGNEDQKKAGFYYYSHTYANNSVVTAKLNFSMLGFILMFCLLCCAE